MPEKTETSIQYNNGEGEMKRLGVFSMMLGAFGLVGSQGAAEAKVGVRTGPPPPGREVVAVHQRAHSIWVPGYYRCNTPTRNHEWVSGKWIETRPGFIWVEGRWKQTRHGWIHVEGHWGKA